LAITLAFRFRAELTSVDALCARKALSGVSCAVDRPASMAMSLKTAIGEDDDAEFGHRVDAVVVVASGVDDPLSSRNAATKRLRFGRR